MQKYEKGGVPVNENLFVCTSEKEIELAGTLDSKGVPHTSNKIPESIAKAVRPAIEKEFGIIWRNDHR